MKAASPAQQGRPARLGKRRRRVLAPQSAQGQPDAAAGADVSAATPRFAPTVLQLHRNGRLFPPNYLHDSWLDYLYWDTEFDL